MVLFASNSFAQVPSWLLFLELGILALVAAYLLQGICNATGTDLPSFRKGLMVTVLGAVVAFFTFDLLGYGLVRGTMDITHLMLPPEYGYFDWLKEPMALKWRAMGLVPILRYLPIVFAVCLAGIIYILGLGENWRIVVVILSVQWTLTALASMVLSFAMSNIVSTFVAKPKVEEQQAKATSQTIPRSPTEYRNQARRASSQAPQGQQPQQAQPPLAAPGQLNPDEAEPTTLNAALSSHNWLGGGQIVQWGHELIDKFHELVDPLVKPMQEEVEPYLDHLPPVVREFLDDGGWLLVLLVVAVLGLLWVRSIYRRLTRSKRRRKNRSRATPQNPLQKLEVDLEQIGIAVNEPHKHQVTVRDFPGRLRLVVMAPAASYVGDLLPEMAESLLDYIQPGLGAVYENDTPRVLVWPRMSSEAKFLDLVQKVVKIPEERGRKTPWLVTAGTTQLGRQRIYLCVGTHLDRPSYMREIRVPQGKWSEILGIAPVQDD